jgi:hypothetical protein
VSMPTVDRSDVAPTGTERVNISMLAPSEHAAYRLGYHAGRKLVGLGQPSVNRLDGKMRPTLAAAWRRGYADAREKPTT